MFTFKAEHPENLSKKGRRTRIVGFWLVVISLVIMAVSADLIFTGMVSPKKHWLALLLVAAFCWWLYEIGKDRVEGRSQGGF